MKRPLLIIIAIILFIFVTAAIVLSKSADQTKVFDGLRAYKDIETQISFGPRIPQSDGHNRTVNWTVTELNKAGWQTQIQETSRMGHPIRNVIAKRGSSGSWIILGAHYDTRMVADRDPDPQKRSQPVPGANDGASGVAVLLELARTLPTNLDKQIWLVFFDAEDQGNIPGWDWILGSRAFTESLTSKPDAVIVVDMVGDANLNIFQEQKSDAALSRSIWEIAARIGHSSAFIPQPKYAILDDHTPFLEKGIRAVDIIDIEYSAWHTTSDTTDKVSALSLKMVGDILTQWLMQPIP